MQNKAIRSRLAKSAKSTAKNTIKQVAIHRADKQLTGFYLLLHTLVSLGLLYLFTESLPKPHVNPSIAFILFLGASLFFGIVMLSPRLSLRILWAALSFIALYILIQASADYLAIAVDNSAHAISVLYNILQARMSILLSLLFLCSTILALRFARYRSLEALLLLSFSFFLLTRSELSLSFDSRYWLYRLFWLALPLLGLGLLGLALHPSLRKDNAYLPRRLRQREAGSALPRIGRQLIYFLLLVLLIFVALWLSKISPVNWNQSSRGSKSGNGLLRKNLNNQFNFGDDMQLDSSLDQDRQLVMMAKIEDLREDRPSYLTRFTLGGISDERSFFRDPKEPNMPGESPLPLELERGTTVFEMPQYDLRQKKQMDVFLLNINPSSLFVLNYPNRAQTYENWPDSSFSRVYRIDARIMTDFFPFGEVLSDYRIPEENLAYYTSFPERYKDIGDFALQILQQELGDGVVPEEQMPLELADVFTQYFHREYLYSLKPGIAEDGDQLRYFLYHGKKGYCTYFASSAALMLRSLGVPTRVAVGFLLKPELRTFDYYPLFADQAHAWIEVYDPQQGWVTFDPTSSELAPDQELEFGLPESSETDLAALTEELLRNDLLNAEDGLNKLAPEQSAAKTILLNILEAFRSQVWLLPTTILLLIMLALLVFRLYLGHFALRAKLGAKLGPKINPNKTANETLSPSKSDQNLQIKRSDRIATAMYYYLMLLHSQSFQQSFGPIFGQQLPALSTWKQRLEELRLQTQTSKQTEFDSETSRFLACLHLLQKYFFAPQFSVYDLAALRHELRQIKSRSSWNPIFIIKIFSLFFFRHKNLRSWRRQPERGPEPSSA